MTFGITPYVHMRPVQVRQLIREEAITFPTAGICQGYAQANLVILPPEYADDFEMYAQKKSFPLPRLRGCQRDTSNPRHGRRRGYLYRHPQIPHLPRGGIYRGAVQCFPILEGGICGVFDWLFLFFRRGIDGRRYSRAAHRAGLQRAYV